MKDTSRRAANQKILHTLDAGVVYSFIIALKSNDPIAWQITEVFILFPKKLREDSAKTVSKL